MRYQNWDVLLFPGESKIPIQEFQVKFHVLHDRQGIISSRKPSVDVGESSDSFESMTLVPILTSFVPSLQAGNPFRISLHSWDKPQPSSHLMKFKTSEEIVLFEARVYIDAALVAQRTFGDQTMWPEVIESVENPNYPNKLRFPPFHSSVLQQSHWDAGDTQGRIRVSIAEGVLRENSPIGSQKYSFDRLRDIVIFSFQHVPKNVLEYSGIAWPNARAFSKASASVPTRQNLDHEAHAHSPQRLEQQKTSRADTSTQSQMPAPGSYSHNTMNDWSRLLPLNQNCFEDPFIGPSQYVLQKPTRKFSADTSMPDCLSRISKSEMSGVTFEQRDLTTQISQTAVDDIAKALSPSQRNELLALLTPGLPKSVKPSIELDGQKKTKARPTAVRDSNPALRERVSSANFTESSSGSKKTSSRLSSMFSWEENSNPADTWQNTEYPGLLSSIKASYTRRRSDSNLSKRKRTASPERSDGANDAVIIELKGMSTSPCKCSPTPTKNSRTKPGGGGVILSP